MFIKVSLSNLVFDKRKSRPKVYRSSWITPIKQLTAVKNDTDDQRCITLPSKLVSSYANVLDSITFRNVYVIVIIYYIDMDVCLI